MNTKNLIRQQIIQQRKQLDFTFQSQKSVQIAEHLLRHVLWQNAQHIACYLAYKGEVDTAPIIQAIWRQNKTCYLPTLTESFADYTMEFSLYQASTALEKNRYGILQPAYKSENNRIAVENIDLILVPLVAYDARGNRLGMGAGFYDRALNFKQIVRVTKPLIIGLAYSLQQVEQIPIETWDVGLDGVVTENGVSLFINL